MPNSKIAGLVLLTMLQLTARTRSQSVPAEQDAPECPGVLQKTFNGHTGQVYCIAISSDGKTVVSGAADKTVRVWDVETGKERRIIQLPKATIGVAISADGARLATGSGDQVQIWDADSGKSVETFHAPGPVSQVAWPAGGNCLGASGKGWGCVWSLETNTQVAKVIGNVPRGGFSPDGSAVALTDPDGTVGLWSVSANKSIIAFYGHTGQVAAVAFSPDGKLIATGGFAGGMKSNVADRSVRIWDRATGQQRHVLLGHRKGIGVLTFSPDSKTLLAADFNGSMKLWDVEEGVVRSRLEQIKIGDRFQGTPVGQWSFAPDLKAWAASSGPDILWLDITALTSAPARR